MNRFIEIDENPVPRDASVVTFQAPDGARLRAGLFPAPGARGTVIVAPGWAEFTEKYFEVVDALRDRGLNVAIMDWRGQGLSTRPDKWAGYFETLASDLKAFRDGPVAARFGGPYLLLTHSMGGLPALLLLASGDEGFSRAVLTAPMTRLFNGAGNAVYGAVAATACMAGGENAKVFRRLDDSKAFEGNVLTKDPSRHERFRLLQEAEPDIALFAPTYGWVREAVRTSKRIHEAGFFDRLKTPVKVISAGDEQVIDGADHAAIAAMSEHIDHVTVDGAFHEIMMERDEYRKPFWNHVDAFFAPALNGAE